MVKIGKLGEEDGAKKSETGSAEGVSPETERRESASSEHDSVILMELRKLRQEHAEAASDNKRAMARLETNMKELMERTASLEQRAGHMEERIGNRRTGRHGWSAPLLSYSSKRQNYLLSAMTWSQE